MLRLAEDRSKDPHDPHKIYEFVNSGVLEAGVSMEEWDFKESLAPLFHSPPLSPAVGDFPELEASPNTDGSFNISDTQVRMCPTLLPFQSLPITSVSCGPVQASFSPWTIVRLLPGLP